MITKEDFQICTKIYVSHITDNVEEYIILESPTEQVSSVKAFCVASDWEFRVGKVVDLFPGDLGVPGYNYDNRPCCVFLDKESAQAELGAYFKWLKTSYKYGNKK